MDLAHFGDEFLVVRMGLQAAVVFPEFLDVVLDLFAKVLNYLLLVVKADVDPVHGGDVLLELLLELLLPAGILH